MAEIIFDEDFPKLIKKEVEKLINETAWLIPLWLQKLYVGYKGNDEDSNAFNNTRKDYRFARIMICGNFLKNRAFEQKQTILHEILHIHNCPYLDYVDELIDLLCPESDAPKFRESMQNELTRKAESMTEDVAFAIAKFNESKGDLQK